jgi:hypothetical protein
VLHYCCILFEHDKQNHEFLNLIYHPLLLYKYNKVNVSFVEVKTNNAFMHAAVGLKPNTSVPAVVF